jgi:phosphoglucan,water dikinase
LSEAYGDVPTDIANAFGLPEHLGVTHVEALVRAGVPFQISRYVAPMLRAASDAAGCRPGGYDAVSLGVARGVLVECQSIEPGSLGDPLTSGPVVALAWTADGDEEVRAAGAHVKGVVLARDLPHLSHLAIRARQEKTPLAATEDASALHAARGLLGKEVILEVTPDGATLRAVTTADVAIELSAATSAGGGFVDDRRHAVAHHPDLKTGVPSPRLGNPGNRGRQSHDVRRPGARRRQTELRVQNQTRGFPSLWGYGNGLCCRRAGSGFG